MLNLTESPPPVLTVCGFTVTPIGVVRLPPVLSAGIDKRPSRRGRRSSVSVRVVLRDPLIKDVLVELLLLSISQSNCSAARSS